MNEIGRHLEPDSAHRGGGKNRYPLKRLKWIARLQYGDSLAATERQDGDVPVFGSNGKVDNHHRPNTLSPTIIVGRKGSFGKITFSSVPSFCIDTAYFIDSRHTHADPRWLYWALQTLDLDSVSEDTGVPGLSREVAHNSLIPDSSPSEQREIADFLDRETGRIDALLDDQQRMIDLLNENITSLVLSSISSTKTKEMRFQNSARIIKRPVIQREGELYTPIGLFNRGRGLFHKNPSEMDGMGDSDFFWIEEGDLIISGQFAWEGAVALASAEDAGCVVSHRYPVLRGKPGISLTEYLLALLLTKHGDFLLNENSRGAAGRNRPLNINSLLKEKVPIPDMRTQEKIAQAVYWRNDLLSKMSKQDEILKEHRRALISAAVTGQIDVRNYRSPEVSTVCQ